MGLVIILVMGLYLLIAIGVVSWVISYAKKNGKRVMRWGWGAAFVMFLIPFWDWIPTVAAHKYYCATEAGFWVYKTPEQWEEENPGVMKSLVHDRLSSDYKTSEIIGGFNTTYTLNQRMKVINNVTRGAGFLELTRNEYLILDSKTSNVLTKRISFESGKTSGAPNKLSDFKFWINNKQCKGVAGNSSQKMWGNTESLYRNIGEEK